MDSLRHSLGVKRSMIRPIALQSPSMVRSADLAQEGFELGEAVLNALVSQRRAERIEKVAGAVLADPAWS